MSKNKTFEDWKTEELELAFGIKQVDQHPLLVQWQAAIHEPEADFYKQIQFMQTLLKKRIEFWNEDELKFMFISPLLNLVNLNGENYSTFTQRPIIEKVPNLEGEQIILRGRPEFIVSLGKQDPRQPFFFIHEYKPEIRRDNDPRGQLLAAMIATQYKNDNDFLLKGCYVNGRNWFFLVLDGNKYSVTDAYVATQDDIYQIFSLLVQAKIDIEDYLFRRNLL
jgi:hypothetical protein